MSFNAFASPCFARKSAAGPDLTKLFIGAEGTLGLVTEVTLKLQPALPTSVGVAHFSDVESATQTVLEIVKSGISLSCIELLDEVMMKAINLNLSSGKWAEKPRCIYSVSSFYSSTFCHGQRVYIY